MYKLGLMQVVNAHQDLIHYVFDVDLLQLALVQQVVQV